MPISSRTYAKICCAVCQNCTLGVHRFVFMGSIFFGKNTFPTVLHNLGGLFLGFWQIFSSTVVKTTLASRFSYSGLCQFCSGFTENFIGRSIRTALYVSTVLFSWVASSLGKTLFLLYFTF